MNPKTSPRRKTAVRCDMRVRAYEVLFGCVERGVSCGMARAYKYSADPEDDTIRERVIDEVMGAIQEFFDFEEARES